ncbi:ATP-binding cassette sub-family C member 10 isoform X2 [Hyperolius riggenbachi]|uniref:ATP-binding cassette sub-family C member 10 isoform X2 n=1 Tax=Hyperolius riggenbachi TaxID=752182 RepID=UPI0035A3CB0C
MEDVIAQLCRSSQSDPLPVWVNGHIGTCFNQLILSTIPHVVFAVCSACHAGSSRNTTFTSLPATWLCRILFSFLLVMFCAANLALGAFFPLETIYLLEVLSGGVSCLSWFTHFLVLLRLRKTACILSRGPVILVLPILLLIPSMVITVVSLSQEGAMTSPLNSVLVARFSLSSLQLCVVILYLGVFLAPTSPRRYPINVSINDGEEETTPLISPAHIVSEDSSEDNESLLSQFFYFWLKPLMNKGANGGLKQPQDVSFLPYNLCTARVRQKFLSYSCAGRLRILSSLHACFGTHYCSLGVIKLFSVALGFMGPLLLNLLVNFMETQEEPLSWGVIYVTGLFVSGFLGAILQNQYIHQINKLMLAVRTSVLTAVYHKAICGEGTRLAKFSTGEVMNLLSTDTDRVSNFYRSFHELWSLPLQLSVTLYLLYQQVGIAFLGGLGLALLLVPLNKVVATGIMNNIKEMLLHKDTRVKIVTELLSGIRVVKFYTWEEHFFHHLNNLSAAKVFTALALVEMLILPLNNFPWLLNGILEAKISLDRIQRFLELPDQDLLSYYKAEELPPGGDTALEVRDAMFSWRTNSGDGMNAEESSSLQLFIHHLSVCKGALVAVVGKVGCGKSSLLAAITGELNRQGGDLYVWHQENGFGFVAQEPWIQFATIRDNILFGKEYNERLYNEVLEACALFDDLTILPAGDQTEVGENGITLSGGQKARISLARAVYQEKELLLLDDPLAAVDADVASHLMEKCILGILRQKTRILCTHRTELLQRADVVILMEAGRIVRTGPPDEILSLAEVSPRVRPSKSKTQGKGSGSSLVDRKDDDEETLFPGSVMAEEEGKKEGAVSLHVYASYWRAVGSCLGASVLLALLLMQASRNMSDWWLSHWIASFSDKPRNVSISGLTRPAVSPVLLLFSSGGLVSPLRWAQFTKQNNSQDITFYLTVYGGIAAANSVFTALRALLFAFGAVRAATVIHTRLLQRMLRATVSFFDSTPVGRIINRFSSDLYCVDDTLPYLLNIFLANVFGLLGMLVMISYGLPWILPVLLPLAVLYYYIQRFYRHTSRELKRLQSITLSPIYSHFSETLTGLSTIRATRQADRFEKECEARLERNQRCVFTSNSAVQWLDIRLQMIGVVVVSAIAVIAIIQHQRGAGDPGLIGLSLSYALSITGLLSGLISSFTQTEAMMVSVERTEEYSTQLPCEPREGTVMVDPGWPSTGCIEFKDAVLCYRPGLPNALDGVSFTISPGEKVGIVGRTGSGKSSLFLALFRMMELNSGLILIDDIPTQELNVEVVRSRLAIIPQDAFLFSGSVRENLDPLSLHLDTDLLDVLSQCHLLDLVERIGGLDAGVGDRGKNFSLGQRQLLCLARALLTQAKILCIDEATASVDHQTDQLLQLTIRERFKDHTVLTIAHRLNTIMDSDRILVMHAGKVAEMDSPTTLSNNENSNFYRLINSGQL